MANKRASKKVAAKKTAAKNTAAKKTAAKNTAKKNPLKKKPAAAEPAIPVSQSIWTRGVIPASASDWQEDSSIPGSRYPDLLGRRPDLFPPSGRRRPRRWPDLFGGATDARRWPPLFGLGPSGNSISQDRWAELFGTGFVRDRADGRDHSIESISVRCPDTKMAARLRGFAGEVGKAVKLPEIADIDVDATLGQVDHQGPVQSCTAHVVTSMAEYHLHKQTGVKHRLSVLFLYKIARDLLGVDGDRGCTMREALKALNKYGCVPEAAWPYWPQWLEKLPRIPDFEVAEKFSGLRYVRLDTLNQTGDDTLRKVMESLAAGLPVGFGFTLYGSIDKMGKDGSIPMPSGEERDPDARVLGAHAVMATGYKVTSRPGAPLKGALKIRNSWGTGWGNRGYAWLPFEYVTRQYARDFWVLYPPAEKSFR